jgi:hypothetical protein
LDEVEGEPDEVAELPESDEAVFDSAPVDFDSDAAAGFPSPALVFAAGSLPSLPSVPFRA